jgi:serine protease Do
MSAFATGSAWTRHRIEGPEPLPRRRNHATRVVVMAVRPIFAVVALALTILGFALGTPTAHADQTSVDAKIGQSLVYIDITSTGYVLFPAGVLDAESLASVGFDPDTVEQNHWVGPLKTGGSCSGVIVDPTGYIATAGHCVGGDALEDKQRFYREAFLAIFPDMSSNSLANAVSTATNEEWPVEGKDPGSQPSLKVEVMQPQVEGRIVSTPVTADVVDFQKFGDGDNALLKVPGLPPLHALPVADHVPAPGTAVTSAGYPGAVSKVIDPNSLQQPSFKDGTVSGVHIQQSGAATTEVSAASSPGMSGGPTVNNATGEVIGLNDFGVFNDQHTAEVAGTNFITDASGLHAFLVRNGVQLVALPTPAKPFPWLWIAVGSVVLVTVAALATIAMWLRRRRHQSKLPADALQAGTQQYVLQPPQSAPAPSVVHSPTDGNAPASPASTPAPPTAA